MLVRLRWFLLGAAATAWGGVVVIGRLARLRERLTPANLAREGGTMAADWLQRLGDAVAGREGSR
ncbi:MAG TPA: hypothetical protein VLD62_10500 [Acidimicrobiia bacterium]|nr:hypothetical protein [Acidimicrobiia bacterium]